MVAFIIWSIVASLFVVIGIVNWRSKTEVGFFTGVKPGKKKDIVGYNHAVAKIWFFYAAVLEMIGLPFVFIPQNSIMAVVVMLAIVALTIGIMIVYVKIDAKYKEV
ncbi:MAG: hypothetical protein HFJ03_04410 [Lachnospira sp.]|jgi:hypothetical protein|nr:hypothetical protein [Lachnospira sp.]